MTSFPSVWTDLRNAGATVIDSEVVTDARVVSSRDPADLDVFCAAIEAEFGRAVAG